jgi:hypothetical protein
MHTSNHEALRVLSAVATIGGLLLLPTQEGHAQQDARQVIGTWTLVSVDNVQADGSKVALYGRNPRGILMFDGSGRYSLQLCQADRPRFASNNRNTGTAEENQAAVQGCNPHWGRYSVSDGAVTFQNEHAMFANWEGQTQKRTFTIAGDQLKYIVPTSSVGSGSGEVVWRRAK